jgi:hypothetical protein
MTQTKTGSLDNYEEQIEAVIASDLTTEERGAALHLLAQEIERCAWAGHAKTRAVALALRARAAIPEGDLLAGLDELAARGALRVRRVQS